MPVVRLLRERVCSDVAIRQADPRGMRKPWAAFLPGYLHDGACWA